MDAVNLRLANIESLLRKLSESGLPDETNADLDIIRQEMGALVEELKLDQQQNIQDRAQFVSVVTHELRIPLTSIKGYTDLLRQGAVGPVNDQQENFLFVIRNNAARMSALISNLSDIAKLETDRLRLDCVAFPLHDLVDQTLEEFAPVAAEKNQTLLNSTDAGLPLVVADLTRFKQIIENLLDNASRYTPEGGEISIAAEQDDGFVRVEISDNGIGISPADQEKMFTQFFRSEDQAVRETQGWGLGLVVTKLLIEAMGGALGFESNLGKGSRFWCTLLVSDPLGTG